MLSTDRSASLILLSAILFFSCATTKPDITTIPDQDLFSYIYFFSDNSLLRSDSYSRTKIDSPFVETIFKPGVVSTFLGKFGNAPIFPSINPFGDYLAFFDKEVAPTILRPGILDSRDSTRETIGRPKKGMIKVFDIKKKTITVDLEIDLPLLEYENEINSMIWSRRDSGFFVVQADTIMKCYPDGKKIGLVYVPKVHTFSISPSENLVFIFHEDKAVIYDMGSKQFHEIKTFGKALGLFPLNYLRGVAWSVDEERLSFSEGWRIYVHDIRNNGLDEFKTKSTVFAVEWLSNEELVFVEGDYPADLSAMQTTKYFKIVKLNIDERKFTVLHERASHEPLSVKPLLSPSKHFILFSEKKLNGPYQIKLMSLDGQRIRTIANGSFPVWVNRTQAVENQ